MTAKLGRYIVAGPTIRVRLVAIDKESLARYGPWPWPNDLVRALDERLAGTLPRSLLVAAAPPMPQLAPRFPSDLQLDLRLSADPRVLRSMWMAPRARHRELPLLEVDKKSVRPSPALADAMSVAGVDSLAIKGAAAAGAWSFFEPGISTLAPPDKKHTPWATSATGGLRLLPADAPTGLSVISAWRILKGNAALERELRGSVVVVHRVSSANAADPAWREAQGVAQLLNGLTPQRPFWALPAEALISALCGAIVSLLMVVNRVRSALGTAFLSVLAAGVVAVALFSLKLWLIDPLTPTFFIASTVGISGLGLTLRQSLGSNAAAPARKRTQPATIEGVERREVTAFACEIRDLSAVSEAYRDKPQALARLVNKVLTTVADIVRAHRGTVESIGPTGLLAVFNAPATEQRHAERAAEAALACVGRLDPINESLEKLLQPTGVAYSPVNLSIGIDSGDAIVGDLGLKARREFGAFGPAFDSAASLAALSRTYGPAILVGEAADAHLNRKFALLELDLKRDSDGRLRRFYALLGNPVLRANPRFKALQEGFQAFHMAYRRGNWDQAARLLTQCAKLPGVSPRVVRLFGERLAYLKAAPLKPWDGVLRLPGE